MSVDGYIVREKSIWVDEKNMICQWNNDGENLVKYEHKSEEFCMNMWSQTKLLNEMFKFGANDYTNCETVGLIEMEYDDFWNMVENSEKNFDSDDKESIKIIIDYFDENELNYIVTLNCY